MTEPAAYGHSLKHNINELERSLEGASRVPFWQDNSDRPAQRPSLSADVSTDLLIVGGGYCGLWAAVQAKERNPERDVLLLESQQIGWAASGRNGGFLEASLTHGEANGSLHFADELATIERLAEENFQEFEQTLERHNIDAEFEKTGVLSVATEPHQVEEMRSGPGALLESEGLERFARSPLYRAGKFQTKGAALVHPAKLAWGLASTAEKLGVRIYEGSPVTSVKRVGNRVVASTPQATVLARSAILATNGFPSLLRRLHLSTVPIYDYALMTEPLSEAQLDDIGWVGRHGITDSGREFHYYRKSRDNRILFGGYDAVYHRGGKVRPEQDHRHETYLRLADHFFLTFPQLAGLRFTHTWGGMIDMSTRLCAHHGVAAGGRIAYSAGYTGLGVGATRFGAAVMLDLIDGLKTERAQLRMSRTLPIPVPPEPIAYPLIQTMRKAVAKSDQNGGKDGFLLKAASLFGVGFDS